MPRRVASVILGVVLLCTGIAPGALRIALIGAGLDKDHPGLLDLAEAKLSEDKRIDLLERNSIRTVLQEQKLSLAGMVSADQAVAAGKLLRVEVFAVVQSLGSDDPPVLTVFDGFNGARLIDLDLPREGIDAQVAAIASGVDRARSKLAAPLHSTTLCLLAVRNADLPRSMDGACQTVAALLERQLLASDDVRLLERKQLEGINKERQLGTLDPRHDILASLTTVELEFSRGADGRKPTVTALLSDANGKPLVDPQNNALPGPSALFDVTNVAESVNQLAARIADVLRITPGDTQLNPHKEASRFAAEASFLSAHDQVPQALAAAESAYALDRNGYASTRMLAFTLLRRASDMVRKKEGDDVRALEMAARSFDVRDQRIRVVRATNPQDEGLHLYTDNVTGDRTLELLRHAMIAPANADPAITAAARELGDAYIAFTHDWLTASESIGAEKPALLRQHIDAVRLNRMAACMALASASMHQYVDEICGLYERYFNILANLDPKVALNLYLDAGRDLGDVDAYWRVNERQWKPADFTSNDLQQIENLFAVLTNHPTPAVRFYGLWNRLRFEDAAERLSDSAFDALVAETTKAARDALVDADFAQIDRSGFERNLLSGNAMSLLSRSQPKQRRLADRLDWYDFMIQHEMISEMAIVRLVDFQFMGADADRIVDVLARLNQLANGSGCNFIHCSASEARVQLARQIRYLAKIFPPVRDAFVGSGDDVHSLLTIGGPILAIDQVVADASNAFAIVLADDNGQPTIEALSLALDGSGYKTIGSLPGNVEVHDACINETQIAVATNHGIFLYQRNGAPPSRLTSDDGLPTDDVQSVAILGDVIYAGLGDKGYFISFDVKSRECRVLASSRRKQKLSPFDDVPHFELFRVVADEAKHRILLTQCFQGQFPQNGLWQFDANSGNFAQIFNAFFKYRDHDATHLLPDGRMVIDTDRWAAVFDTRDDSTHVLFSDFDGVNPRLRHATTSFTWNQRLAQPFTLVGNDLWAGDPLTRTDAHTGACEPIDLPPESSVRPSPSTRPSRIHPTTQTYWRLNNRGPAQCDWILPLADGKHVIVGNARVLWLVPSSGIAPTSQPATTRPTTQK